MIRTEDQPEQVRHHEPHEPHDTAHGSGEGGEHRGEDHQLPSQPAHVHTKTLGASFPQTQQVQIAAQG